MKHVELSRVAVGGWLFGNCSDPMGPAKVCRRPTEGVETVGRRQELDVGALALISRRFPCLDGQPRKAQIDTRKTTRSIFVDFCVSCGQEIRNPPTRTRLDIHHTNKRSRIKRKRFP